MYKIITIQCMALIAATTAMADDVLDLRPQLTEAAASTGSDYLRFREGLITAATTNALFQAVADPRLDWRERLVARIVLERKLRGDDTEAMRRYDWKLDPAFNRDWLRRMGGYAGEVHVLASQRLREAGLWYAYLEINWKDTGELSKAPRAPRLEDRWPFYTGEALADVPEQWYLNRVRSDLIATPNLQRVGYYFQDLYRHLLDAKDSDAVPALVERFEQYYKATDPGPSEVFPGARDMTIRSVFDSVISIADQRHAELLDAYITAHPVLEPLRKELDAVRQRPAPEPIPEPPFRVMPTPEFLIHPPKRRDPAEARWPVLHLENTDATNTVETPNMKNE